MTTHPNFPEGYDDYTVFDPIAHAKAALTSLSPIDEITPEEVSNDDDTQPWPASNDILPDGSKDPYA